MLYRGLKVVLIIPCYNEEAAISEVINSFKRAMPPLEIYVFDNNSTDQTVKISKNIGAKVINVSLRGKGNVVRRMFSDVDSDIYVMVDGDGTYDADSVIRLIDKLIDDNLDMVVGCREVENNIAIDAYRKGHQWGNKMLTFSTKKIFGGGFTDMLSGYRAFTRRYVKSFPALSKGFEIETELTVHALHLRMPYGEIMTPYGARKDGSESKLSTYKDGLKILITIIRLYMIERPMEFYAIASLFLFMSSVILFVPVIGDYFDTGLVPRFPTLIISVALMISSILSLVCGLVLDNVSHGRQENKHLAYLSYPNKLLL